MKLTAQTKSNNEFGVTVESYNNDDVNEIISVFNRDLLGYTVEEDFKSSLFSVLRDVADFERISLAELLCSYLSEAEKEEILYELNVI